MLREISASRLAGLSDARDGLQIGEDAHLIPASQQGFSFGRNGTGDFHDEPSAGTKGIVSLRNEAGDDLEPGGAGEDGVARLEFADFGLRLTFFGLADI